jgi:citrate synthase
LINVCESPGVRDRGYLSAREVAAELGISLGTLYAYVSRGRIHSEPIPGQSRGRRYRRDEVLRLRERRELRREPEQAVARGLHWGVPVLSSAITLIEDGRLYYRGLDAVALANTASVEEVAALVWTGTADKARALFAGQPPALPGPVARGLGAASGLGPIERCQVALAVAGAADLGALDLRPAATAATAARILRLLVGAVAGRAASAPVDATLQAGWGLPPAARRGIRAALVLSADHELNVSAFAARCVASASATLYDVVSGGLAALKGTRHGGHTIRVEALFREAGSPPAARRTIAERLRRGESIPGFGHPLYPDGDPRGQALLALAARVAPRARSVELARAFVEAGQTLLDEHPTIDLGLVTLSQALGLPDGSALALFALGRTIGWSGHAIEQYAAGDLIRPRARYVGPPPAAARSVPRPVSGPSTPRR